MLFKPGMKVKSIVLADGTKLSAGAPHEMEIIMEAGPHCGVPWVRRWHNYSDERFNCALLVCVELAL